MSSSAKEKIIVALDAPNAVSAHQVLDTLGDVISWVKVGLQLFTAEGPGLVRELKGRGYKVFLDLKFHDIPNTAGEAVASAVRLGVDMTTIHLSGGGRMIKAAVDAAAGSNLLVLGVSVLTSMDESELGGVGVTSPVAEHVRRLAQLGVAQGLRGVVCSPLEIRLLRREIGADLTIVTPGVRPAGGDLGDQKRVMTPGQAVREGASFLVIGRPITGARRPGEAVAEIVREIDGVE